MHAAAVFFICIFWLAFQAEATDLQGYKAAKTDFARKDYQSALNSCRADAEQGEPHCQNIIGVMYRNGLGVAKDTNQALHWIRKAANQGEISAQHNLAGMYYQGEGLKKDSAKAFSWFLKAAEQGHGGAQYMAGLMYSRGDGTLRDEKQSVAWLTKVIEQTDAAVPEDLKSLARNRIQEVGQQTSAPRIAAQLKSTTGVGPDDLRVGMTWDEARRTSFLQSVQISLGSIHNEPKRIPWYLKDIESGSICLTLNPLRPEHRMWEQRWDYCNPAAIDSNLIPIPVPFSELAQRDFTLPIAGTFLGAQRRASVRVEKQRIERIVIDFGTYRTALRDDALNALRQRYGNLIGPSDSELADFNATRSSCFAYTTPSQNVTLFVHGGLENPMLQLTYGRVESDCLPRALSGGAGGKL